jgi:hypothetical protein
LIDAYISRAEFETAENTGTRTQLRYEPSRNQPLSSSGIKPSAFTCSICLNLAKAAE